MDEGATSIGDHDESFTEGDSFGFEIAVCWEIVLENGFLWVEGRIEVNCFPSEYGTVLVVEG